MRSSSLLPVLALVAGCSGNVDNDVVGPFTGSVHRYAISAYQLPRSHQQARDTADDLNGDGHVDNQLGMLFANVNTEADIASDEAITAMRNRGLLPSVIEIQAESLEDDSTVGVSYIGRPGDTAVPAGGTFVGGAFTSNRSRSTNHPAAGTLVLPVFVDADPTELVLSRGEIDLTPTPTGYHGLIRGVIDGEAALQKAAASLVEMVENNPRDHATIARILDANHDGVISVDEATQNQFIRGLLSPDLDKNISIGFAFDLIPCDSGDCVDDAAPPSCLDRVKNGNETDVDCGVGCRPCTAGDACTLAGDCDSNVCDSDVCATGTCSDGFQDNLETGVDCGTPYCLACRGDSCAVDAGCKSGVCESDGTCR